MTTSTAVCRCGWDGAGDHPCHRCGVRSGVSRLYVPNLRFSLAGNQMKLSVRDTIACAECWVEFQRELEQERVAATQTKGGV